MTVGRVGIDFGTSSSSVAVAGRDGEVRFARLPTLGALSPSWRSLLFFDPEEQEVGKPIRYTAGGDAIAAYLEIGEGRLVQSFKTHLTAMALGRTQIGHFAIGLDDMIALYLRRLRERAEADLGARITAATIGRPVRFAGGRTDDEDAQAADRLQRAAIAAGFEDVRLALEPVGAAHHYERTLRKSELALVADFGAGTTDFCLMRVGPSKRRDAARDREFLATGGVAAAGDDLDAALIEHLVCPSLGKGDTYVEMGQEHPIPSSYFYKLARWHHLSFLSGTRVRNELERLHRHARHPERIAALMHVIEANQAFHLHKAVERTKIELSSRPSVRFHYEDGPVTIDVEVGRADFDRWISPVVESIATCLDHTLAGAGVSPRDVDCVFMAGGTAFVPAVRELFESRFGAAKLRSGDELVSIASGLASLARAEN
jgi:hypothetical chaperone protein